MSPWMLAFYQAHGERKRHRRYIVHPVLNFTQDAGHEAPPCIGIIPLQNIKSNFFKIILSNKIKMLAGLSVKKLSCSGKSSGF
jgi:hypothetical protein